MSDDCLVYLHGKQPQKKSILVDNHQLRPEFSETKLSIVPLSEKTKDDKIFLISMLGISNLKTTSITTAVDKKISMTELKELIKTFKELELKYQIKE